MKKQSKQGTFKSPVNLAYKIPFIVGVTCMLLFCFLLQAHANNTASSNTTISSVQQQTQKLSGTVKDELGEPIIGATIQVTGTSTGTVTNIDGNFSLDVPANATLQISYIGYLSQSVSVAGRQNVVVILKEDSQSLEEVVVVGYGVQKKKLVTGATVQVSGDNIQKQSTTSALTALQSQTPGVNITQNSGQPGEAFKVVIRGAGTIGDSKPLYVIDGVVGGDINNLNTADIESIDVLKDAASAAIYGARAANGVILVTTKQGKSGKMMLSYDGYAGVQNVYKMATPLNAREYMNVMDEIRFNEGNTGYDWENLLPGYLYKGIMDGTWKGTNWLEEIRNKNAPTQNHAINLTGGNEASKFSMGFSYTSQEGVFGKPCNSLYDRYTARINSDHVLLKGDKFDIIKIGENLTYSYTEKQGIGVGNIYGNDIHNMLVGNPLLPVYNAENKFYDQDDKNREGWLFDGATSNPIGNMAYSGRGTNISKNHNLMANAYIEVQPIQHLKYRSSFGYRMSASTYRSYDAAHNLSNNSNRQYDKVTQNANIGYDITWENTLSYSMNLSDHAIDFLVGQSIEKWGMGEFVEASQMVSLFPGKFEYAWIDNTKPTEMSQISTRGYPRARGALASFFGRANYNYKETYMASLIMRADGSSNFARGHRWGYFPSISAGWVISNEAFMESTQSWLDFLKLRGSWGQNGNAAIDNFQYLATIAFDDENAYYFGENKVSKSPGGYADILPNKNITWETSEQLNIGFDSRFLHGRLGVVFDYFDKKTKNWLVRAPMLASFGTGAPFINGGDLQNKGFELALGWNDQIGDFSYGINLNGSHIKNKVLRIANTEGIIHGAPNLLSEGTKEMNRVQVNYPSAYFYGFKTEGIFQNQAQIDAHKEAGKGLLGTPRPGDIIFSDINKDGVIDEEDKTMIGDPNPDYTLGFGLNMGYKGFDLSVSANGAFGQQVAKSYRSFADSPLENYTTQVFDRWHGEGTSNKWPRLTNGSHPNYQNISDIWIEDASFLRIQNITLGYDFKKLCKKMPFTQVRLYIAAQNVATITPYSGMDPDVGYGGNIDEEGKWSRGIDIGFYPVPRTYLAGLNLKF